MRGMTALMFAVCEGCLPVAEALLQAGADTEVCVCRCVCVLCMCCCVHVSWGRPSCVCVCLCVCSCYVCCVCVLVLCVLCCMCLCVVQATDHRLGRTALLHAVNAGAAAAFAAPRPAAGGGKARDAAAAAAAAAAVELLLRAGGAVVDGREVRRGLQLPAPIDNPYCRGLQLPAPTESPGCGCKLTRVRPARQRHTGTTALMQAAVGRCPAVVRLLVAAGADGARAHKMDYIRTRWP